MRDTSLARYAGGGIQAAAKAVPFVGMALSDIIAQIRDAGQQQKYRKTPSLPLEERDILLQLECTFRDRPCLLVFDDIQFFDERSLKFILFLLREETRAAFPFVGNIRMVATVRSSDTLEHVDQAVVRMIRQQFHQAWPVYYPALDEFGPVLVALGLRAPLAPKDIERIHAYSGGNLKIAAEFVSVISRETSESVKTWLDNTDAVQFLEQVLSEKLRALGDYSGLVAQLLISAAITAKHLPREQLECLYEKSKQRHKADSTTDEIFALACSTGFLEQTPSGFRFSHDVVRSFFTGRAGPHQEAFHAIVGDCLRKLQPGHYLTRFLHAVRAGHATDASSLLFCGALGHIRQGSTPELLDQQEVRTLLSQFNLLDALEAAQKASRLYDNARYAEAMELLDGLGEAYDARVRAELDYLRARCLISTLDDKSRRRCVEITSSWSDEAVEEPEQWARLKTLQVIAFVQLSEWQNARSALRELNAHFGARERYDQGARFGRAQLDRRAASFLAGRPAERRVSKAVEYFGPPGADENTPPRFPREYYMALCNHSSCLISVCEFRRAVQAAVAGERLRQSLPAHEWPFPEFLLNNLVLALNLAGEISIDDAVAGFGGILASYPHSPDRHLLTSNCAAFEILRGDVASALRRLNKASDEIGAVESFDQYYRYFVNTNLAVAVFHSGDVTSAKQLWEQAAADIAAIDEKSRAYHDRRHQLLAGAFDIVEPGEVSRWNGYLLENHPKEVGDTWPLYAHGVAFTTIEHWET